MDFQIGDTFRFIKTEVPFQNRTWHCPITNLKEVQLEFTIKTVRRGGVDYFTDPLKKYYKDSFSNTAYLWPEMKWKENDYALFAPYEAIEKVIIPFDILLHIKREIHGEE
jgi:hypothetical protein